MFQSWLKRWCLNRCTPMWWLIHCISSFGLHIVKVIARKRLLLESWTIFSWKWTLKRSPCWSCAILAPLLIRLIITSLRVWMRSSGYGDWPWNGSGRTWRKEVSESPSTNLSQSALVWSVLSHKGHAWAPVLSSSIASKLFSVVVDQLPHAHCYADDTQIYLSFKPICNISQEDAVHAMQCCIESEDQALADPGQTPS